MHSLRETTSGALAFILGTLHHIIYKYLNTMFTLLLILHVFLFHVSPPIKYSDSRHRMYEKIHISNSWSSDLNFALHCRANKLGDYVCLVYQEHLVVEL